MPRYMKQAADHEIPKAPEAPPLKLCQLGADGKLMIPRDVRQHFMGCPLFGPEWREIVVDFDKHWGSPVAAPTTPNTPVGSGSGNGENGGTPVQVQIKKQESFTLQKEEGFEWANQFPGSPTTLADLKAKFGAELTEMVGVSSTTSFFLAPGPQLYVVAKDATHIKALEAPIVLHGAGSWLTGDKATKFQTNNPDRGIPCRLMSDQEPAVFEDQPCFQTCPNIE